MTETYAVTFARCGEAYHIYCLSPPLPDVPPEDVGLPTVHFTRFPLTSFHCLG